MPINDTDECRPEAVAAFTFQLACFCFIAIAFPSFFPKSEILVVSMVFMVFFGVIGVLLRKNLKCRRTIPNIGELMY